MFKKRSAEREEPNKPLFVAKPDNPTFSCGTRKKIIPINRRLTINSNSFNIDLG